MYAEGGEGMKRVDWLAAILFIIVFLIMLIAVVPYGLAFEHRLYMPLAFMVPAFATIRISKKTFTAFLLWYLALCFWYQHLSKSEYRM